jgi:NAD(P)H-dependent flavin oxidoreductase YrpB (nitropropane dioxygenase family)
MKDFSEVIAAARGRIGDKCKACPVCNGAACRNSIPGPGAKGIGDSAMRNYSAWQAVRLNMDTICASGDPDMSLELFGKKFALPVFAGPVGAVNLHSSDLYTDATYNDVLVKACADSGIAAFTGDGVDIKVMQAALAAISKAGGTGVPTVKPWDMETVAAKMKLVSEAAPFAVAMDIDAAGLPFLKGLNPPAGSKTVEELKEICAMAGRPFILKGIMTVKGALKAAEAGAAGIVVSNHGGRVLDSCPATAEVLPEIAEALKGSGLKILVDGGIRTGVDVFKALAMGADAVIVARPFVTAVYGGAEEGVSLLVKKFAAELDDTMRMCGAASLEDIDSSMVRLPK